MYSQLASVTLNMLKDTSVNRIMDFNQEITSKLKVIGKMEKGKKFDPYNMCMQEDCLYTSIIRTMKKINRWIVLDFCQETIGRSYELLITYERSDKDVDKILYTHLIRDLRNSITGLLNLRFNYSDDVNFCSKVDTLIESIEARLTKYYIEDEQTIEVAI